MTATPDRLSPRYLSSKREGFLDAARGLAIVAIVLSHVMVGVSDASSDGSNFGFVTACLYLFHVPVFAFISGLMLAGSAEKRARLPYFLDRVGTFLWLYIVWTLIQGGFELGANSVRNNKTSLASVLDLWTPISHLWFLTWLAVSTGVALLLRPWRGTTWRLATLAVISIASFSVWGYEGTTVPERGMALVGIFLCGAAISHARFSEVSSRISTLWMAAIAIGSAVLFAVIVTRFHFSPPTAMDRDRSVDSILLGLSGTITGTISTLAIFLVLDRLGRQNRLLQHIGRNTLPVFLLHIIFAAGTRVVLSKAGVEEAWIHVLAGVVMGVGTPMLLVRWLNMLPGLLTAPWPAVGTRPRSVGRHRAKENQID